MNTLSGSKNTVLWGRRLFRWRGYTPYPIVILFLFLAHPTTETFLTGLPIIVIGEALRLWSVAYAGKETRELSISTPRLVTAGPFAFVRNPIYIGNMFIYTGVTVIANLWMPAFLVGLWVYFGIQYTLIVAAEETVLTRAFGSAYTTYRNAVPGWLPLRGRFSHPAQTASLRTALTSEKSTFISTMAVLVMLYLRMVLG